MPKTIDELMALVMQLSIDDRIQLAQDVWDSIPENQLPPLPQETIAEIERRSQEYDAGLATTFTWKEVRASALERISGASACRSELQRFAAKLLFQYRIDEAGDDGRVCEMRTILVDAKTPAVALEAAKLRGAQAEYQYENDEGHIVHFEFVGVMDFLQLGPECEHDEVWYEVIEIDAPMQHRDELIPSDEELLNLTEERD